MRDRRLSYFLGVVVLASVGVFAQALPDGSVAYWTPPGLSYNQVNGAQPSLRNPTLAMMQGQGNTQTKTACERDKDCEPMDYTVEEARCTYQVRYFNPLKTTPDPEFDKDDDLTPEGWSLFIENGINAGFTLGRPYTWKQQTRYTMRHKCVNNLCVKWKKEGRSRICDFGCDVGGTERCMCEARDYGDLFCQPGQRDITQIIKQHIGMKMTNVLGALERHTDALQHMNAEKKMERLNA